MLRLCHFVRAIFIFVSLYVAAGNANAVALTASVDQVQGRPGLSLFGGGSAMSSQFVFWAKDWTWDGLAAQFKIVAPFDYAISGTDQALNFGLSGRVAISIGAHPHHTIWSNVAQS
jgi:hypothetical protein